MFGKKTKRCDSHLDRETLVSYVEGTLDAEGVREVKEVLKRCDLCHEFHKEIEGEITSLNLSISLVWSEERISCPHRDILKAYIAGSLRKGESDYLEFHLTEVGCPFCNANLQDLRALGSQEESRYLDTVRERLTQSTSAFLRKTP